MKQETINILKKLNEANTIKNVYIGGTYALAKIYNLMGNYTPDDVDIIVIAPNPSQMLYLCELKSKATEDYSGSLLMNFKVEKTNLLVHESFKEDTNFYDNNIWTKINSYRTEIVEDKEYNICDSEFLIKVMPLLHIIARKAEYNRHKDLDHIMNILNNISITYMNNKKVINYNKNQY